MSEVTTIPIAAVMDILPELVDSLRVRMPQPARESLNLAYDWLLQQDVVMLTAQHVVMPSDAATSVTYLVNRTTRACPCPDATHRENARCKHVQRAWLFMYALQQVETTRLRSAA